jgi:hypothetical protein
MEKNQPTDQGRIVSSPLSKQGSSFGVKNPSTSGNIRSIINLPSGAWIGEEARGLIRVITSDKSSLFNLKYYTLIGADKTQQELIKRVLKKINKPSPIISKTIDTPKPIPTQPSKNVDTELNQIVLIERLIKKVDSWNTRREKAKTTKDQDKFILLGRQLKKDRNLIDSILSTLKQDNCFSIKDNYIHYNGQFASCKRLLPDGGF